MSNLVDRTKRNRAVDAAEAAREQTRQYCLAELAQAQVLEDFDPANEERQRGRTMFPHELEALLTRVTPPDFFQFEVHPSNPSKRVAWAKGPDGNRWCACVYENRLMPEYSVMDTEEKWVADPNCFTITPEMVKEHGRNAGMKKITVPYMEVIRGWRTILIKLILNNVIKVDQIERLVGGSNRETWAAKAKRRSDAIAPY